MVDLVSTDSCTPSEIEHKVDQIHDGTDLIERYNYIDYHFESDLAYCRARSYLDEIDKVAIYGPFRSKDCLEATDKELLRTAVLEYLQRRYFQIEKLGDDGYVTIWRHDQ